MIRAMVAGDAPDIRLMAIDKSVSGDSTRVWLVGTFKTRDEAMEAQQILSSLLGRVDGRLDQPGKETIAGQVHARMSARHIPRYITRTCPCPDGS